MMMNRWSTFLLKFEKLYFTNVYVYLHDDPFRTVEVL